MTLQIAGKRFGKLVVQNKVGTDRWKNTVWQCLCDCGKTCTATATSLRSGRRSCSKGCGHTLNLAGRQFGHLIAIRQVGKNNGDGCLWECACSCGQSVTVPAGRLTRTTRPTQSCGCARHASLKTIIGRRFGKLVVIQVSLSRSKRGLALCKCDCGGKIVVRTSQLLSGVSQGCGCLRHRRGSENPLWRHELSQDDRNINRARYYGWPELRRVRKRVFDRDDYRCMVCGCRSSPTHPLTLNAHHLESWCSCVSKRIDEANMETVCNPCHTFFHHMYGDKSTPSQFNEFKGFFIR
jgi:hypothetical protein